MDRKEDKRTIINNNDTDAQETRRVNYEELEDAFAQERAAYARDEATQGGGNPPTGGKKRRRNLETNIISLIFVGLFAVLIIYFANFNAKESQTLAESPYNWRNTTEKPPNPIRRGMIFASDGTVLARTALDGDGKEYRTYPEGELFAVPVGMSRGGGSGIEGAFYEDLETATNKIVVDDKASDIDETEYQGNNVYLTIKPYLQQEAYDALGDERGAIIAIEPSTGKILAMVSKPTYDPNKGATDYSEWAAMDGDDSVLINRATQGLYTPGSIFKMMTTIEYMKEKPESYMDFSYYCGGTTFAEGGTTVNCSGRWAHGTVNLREAFVVSCNTSFSTIGLSLDQDNYKATAESFGFNQDLPIEIESNKSRFMLDGNSETSEIQATSYGQGDTLTTPLQSLLVTATVANGGNMMKPYMVERVLSPDGEEVKNYVPMIYRNGLMTQNQAEVLGDYMYSMVNEGLEDVYGENPYQVAGKTGTAEYENDSDNAHMWFTCFAPYKDPKIAVICVMEKTEIDYTKATTACKKVIDAYLGD